MLLLWVQLLAARIQTAATAPPPPRLLHLPSTLQPTNPPPPAAPAPAPCSGPSAGCASCWRSLFACCTTAACRCRSWTYATGGGRRSTRSWRRVGVPVGWVPVWCVGGRVQCWRLPHRWLADSCTPPFLPRQALLTASARTAAIFPVAACRPAPQHAVHRQQAGG